MYVSSINRIKLISSTLLILSIVLSSIFPISTIRAQATTKRVLTKSDFTYLGTSILPYTIGGKNSMYNSIGLAMRKVNGDNRYFVSVQGDIMEIRIGTIGQEPTLVKNWGPLPKYWTNEPQGLTSMYFNQTSSDGSGQLWFQHAYFYHVTGTNDPHLSVAVFNGENTVNTYGPFTTSDNAVYNKTRAGITSWKNGKLLIGPGGHYAGVSSASLGLFAGSFDPIVPSVGGKLNVTTLVDHGYDFTRSQKRLGDYSSLGIEGGIWPQPDTTKSEPNGRTQYYDQIDTFVYIDTGTAHGLISEGDEATGVIEYLPGGSSPKTIWRTYWRIFDPDKVEINSGGSLEPESYFRVSQGSMGDPDYGRAYAPAEDGMNNLQKAFAYDPETGILALFNIKLSKLNSGGPEYERMPGIVFWKINTTTPLPTPTPVPAPNAPSNLSAGAVSTSQINLSWVDNSSNETGFKIERKTGTTSFIEVTTVSSNISTYSDSSLSSGTQYTYRVRAYNSTGNSNYSNEFNVTTPTPEIIPSNPPTVAITAPTPFTAISGIPVYVSANASDDRGVAGVQFKLDGVNLLSEDTTAPYSVLWDTLSSANGSHTLTAVARDVEGNQTTSSEVVVNVNNTTPETGLKIGDSVKTTAWVNVRRTAGGTYIGSQKTGRLGTITQGPADAKGYTWWKVNFKSGADGWVVENYLSKVTTTVMSDDDYRKNISNIYLIIKYLQDLIGTQKKL